MLIPMACSSCPTIRPVVSAWAGFQVAPSAIWEGNGVVPLEMLVYGMPFPSWLTATNNGMKGSGKGSVSVVGWVASQAVC
jgi:hypothetical protein